MNELVYPVGKNVAIWSWRRNMAGKHPQHCLMKGHDSNIVCLAASETGNIIASAENATTRDWATVIIWSGHLRQEVGRHTVHREEVVAVTVAGDGSFVFSLGGDTDGKLIVWDTRRKKPLCSVQVCGPGAGTPTILRSAPTTPSLLGVAGRRVIKVFSFNEETAKFLCSSVNMGLTERHYTDLRIDEKEEFMYGCTTTGDIVVIRLNLENGKVSSVTPVLVSVSAPEPFSKSLRPRNKMKREAIPALTTLVILPSGDIITGDEKGFVRGFRQKPKSAGKTTVSCSRAPMTSSDSPSRAHGTMKITCPRDPSKPLLQQVWCENIGSVVTSLARRGKCLFVGTRESEIHEFFLGTLEELSIRMRRENNLRRSRGRTERRNRQKSENIIEQKEGKTREEWNENGKSLVKRDDLLPQHEEEEIIQSLDNSCSPPPTRLLSSCPSGPIYDLVFPRDVNELIVTAGEFGLRVWNVRNLEELLRLSVPGIACKSCVVSLDLSLILTGWADGRIRGVGAETGVLKWVIDDAHHKAVNCLAITECGTLVSGGADGRVRTWSMSKENPPQLGASVRQHRGEVMSVALQKTEFVMSCGADGLAIVWSLPNLERVFCLKADTVFFDGCFLKRNEIVTVGSDGSVLVWYRHDGSLLADLRVGNHPLTSIHVSQDDKMLVTSEEEGTVKVWNWCKGRVIYEGKEHVGPTMGVKISPDGRFIVSVDKHGTILFWLTPQF